MASSGNEELNGELESTHRQSTNAVVTDDFNAKLGPEKKAKGR